MTTIDDKDLRYMNSSKLRSLLLEKFRNSYIIMGFQTGLKHNIC